MISAIRAKKAVLIAGCWPWLAVAGMAQDAGVDPSKDPVAIVARAEALLKAGDVEHGLLQLWRARFLLEADAEATLHDAAARAVETLLAQRDPLDAARQVAYRKVAEQQVAVAKAYRVKKWFTSADDRLTIAATYDAAAVTKERALLQPRLQSGEAVPKPRRNSDDGRPPNFLSRDLRAGANGTWANVGDELECGAHPGTEAIDSHWHWDTRAVHEDHEISLEFRPAERDAAWNLGLGIGLRSGQNCGYRLYVNHPAKGALVAISAHRVDGMQVTRIATVSAPLPSTADGYLRFGAMVDGRKLTLQLELEKPLVVELPEPPRGQVGVMVGMEGATSCAMRLRNLRIQPLPDDRPSDEELRQQAEERRHKAVTSAVDVARELIERKQLEPASLQLREAWREVVDLPPGVLRDSLEQAIVQMLQKTDSVAKKREQAAGTCAATLAELAEEYGKRGLHRMRLMFARQAARFDPEGQRATVEAALQAVEDWNAAQALARAKELEPPADDGTLLREWFADGGVLDQRMPAWKFEAASASLTMSETGSFSVAAGKRVVMPRGRFSLHVHLPKAGDLGGLCFDVQGPNDFSAAFLERNADGLLLGVYRYTGTWREIEKRAITVDPWRLDGWFDVSVEYTALGVTVRAAKNSVSATILRPRLGMAGGRLGLFAGSSSQMTDAVRVCAFRAEGQ